MVESILNLESVKTAMAELDQLLTEVVQFCCKMYRPEFQDTFSIKLTTVEVKPEYRGTVHERCVMLTWKAVDFDPNYLLSRGNMYGQWQLCWENLIKHLPHLNIYVVPYRDYRCVCYFSIPCLGHMPEWKDAVQGPVKERRPLSLLTAQEARKGRF
jgi:hypothetical protein